MSQANDPWSVAAKDYPYNGSRREQLFFALRYAILAPSTHNTQPWCFEVRDAGVDVRADTSRALEVIDPLGRQMLMSCGAALFNLRVALEYFGHQVSIEYFPHVGNIGPLARLHLAGVCCPEPVTRTMLDAIPRRRTNRQAFHERPVGQQLADELATLATQENAWLLRLHPRDKGPLAEVITAADRAQLGDPSFRKELSQWIVPFGSRRTDGIPYARKDYGAAVPFGLPLVLRTFDIGGEVAAQESALATGSPALFVLGTDSDDRQAWLAAGQAMQAVLLHATSRALSASFLNQALEIDELRVRVSELAGGEGHPQLVLRMGFGPPVTTPTPRRALEDVTTTDETQITAR